MNRTDTAVRRDERRSAAGGSFLVRVWYEDGEAGSGVHAFRGYLRNLKTGEERFVRDPRQVGALIAQEVGEGAAISPPPPQRVETRKRR